MRPAPDRSPGSGGKADVTVLARGGLGNCSNGGWKVADTACGVVGWAGTAAGKPPIRLVELLGGEISAESQEGKGSAFVVQLPIRREAEPINIEQLKKTTPSIRPVQESIAFWGPNDERPRLLIVEDNIDIAQYLRSCLENEFLVHIAWTILLLTANSLLHSSH